MTPVSLRRERTRATAGATTGAMTMVTSGCGDAVTAACARAVAAQAIASAKAPARRSGLWNGDLANFASIALFVQLAAALDRLISVPLDCQLPVRVGRPS